MLSTEGTIGIVGHTHESHSREPVTSPMQILALRETFSLLFNFFFFFKNIFNNNLVSNQIVDLIRLVVSIRIKMKTFPIVNFNNNRIIGWDDSDLQSIRVSSCTLSGSSTNWKSAATPETLAIPLTILGTDPTSAHSPRTTSKHSNQIKYCFNTKNHSIPLYSSLLSNYQ